MKLQAALVKSCWMAASLGMVVPLFAQTSAQKAKEDAAKSTKTSPAAVPAAESKEVDLADIQLPGVVLPRAKGGYLTLEVADGKLKLSFYDEKKKPVAPDVLRATARWNPPTKAGSDFGVLNLSEDGQSLRCNIFVRPPHTYPFYITLLAAEPGANESYIARF